jgi:hypothetical protein
LLVFDHQPEGAPVDGILHDVEEPGDRESRGGGAGGEIGIEVEHAGDLPRLDPDPQSVGRFRGTVTDPSKLVLVGRRADLVPPPQGGVELILGRIADGD